MTERHWFVFYTKSRHEKKVRDLLTRNGYEPFLPMHKVMRQWSDRKKKVEVPLFNSYIFVRCKEFEINNILQTPGIVATIRYNGKPALLREAEYNMINRFIESGFFLEIPIYNESLMAGDKAQVMDGPLAGITGTLDRADNSDKLNFLLDSINQVIRVQIPKGLLKRQ